MGFGDKSSWLAVRGRTVEDVADALMLEDRDVLDWTTGTQRAYEYGVFVARVEPGWTLAYSRLHLPGCFDAADPRFGDWLRRLSRSLDEVWYFANHRVSGYHVWQRFRAGD